MPWHMCLKPQTRWLGAGLGDLRHENPERRIKISFPISSYVPCPRFMFLIPRPDSWSPPVPTLLKKHHLSALARSCREIALELHLGSG